MTADKTMASYAALVEFLGKTLGNHCEMVLLDLREGKRCVTAIANGHISGRVPGAPLTGPVLRLVNRGIWKTRDYVCNYRGRAGERALRSSLFFIKEGGELLGMLCINVDTSGHIKISGEILRMVGIEPAEPVKQSARNDDLYRNREEIIKAVFDELGFDESQAGSLNQEKRLVIIKRLVEQGVFLLRGSVSGVAEKLHCSGASLYRYIALVNRDGN
jgi:predicted transcriptional regulator YheO